MWGGYNLLAIILIERNISINIIIKSITNVFQGNTMYCYHFWYLYALIFIYLLIPVIKPAIDKWKNYKQPDEECWIAISLFLVLTIIIPTLSSIFEFKFFNMPIVPIASYIYYLLCGYWICKWGMGKKLERCLKILWLLQAIVVLILIYMRKDISSILGYCSFVTWESSVLIFNFFVKLEYKKVPFMIRKIASVLSKYSFSMFIVHVLVLMGIEKVAEAFSITIYSWYFTIIQFVGTFILSFLFAVIIEKMPGRKVMGM